MFSQSLGRAAVRSAPPLSATAASTTSSRCIGATVSRGTHARRLSSNKAAPPPGDGHRGSPAPATASETTRAVEGERRPSKGPLRKKAKDSADQAATKQQRDEAFAHVPAVPATHHLREDDVKVSSFFAIHRPISVTVPYPPQSNSTKSFNALFDSPKPSTTRINDTIYTLNNAISSAEGAARPQRSSVPQTQEEREARWELVQQQAGNGDGQIFHLDGPPMANLEQMMKQYKPFNTPPAPIAFDPAYRKPSSRQNQGEESSQASTDRAEGSYQEPPARRKTYSTTLTIEETTQPTGETTFSARCGPVKRIASRRQRENGSLVVANGPHTVSMEEPSQYAQQREMLLISVKRQRKLKMKKHKYKKLMKRTRNLRRRLGRD